MGRFGNYHPVQAKRQFHSMHNSCCFSKTDALHVQQRVAPQIRDFWVYQMYFGRYRDHWENKQENDQKLGTGVDKALSCFGDLLGPMSTLGDIGSYKCHFEMNLETAGND